MCPDDPLALVGVTAIRKGDLEKVERLLAEHPGVANAHVEGLRGGYRTPLHVVSDCPGYFPNGPAMVKLLLAAGADPNGGAEGWGRQETPLHCRAAEFLRAHGADLNWVPNYAKGTPLDVAGGPDTGREALLTWLREHRGQPASRQGHEH